MRLVFLSLDRRSTMIELIQLLDDNDQSLPASSDGRFDWNLTFLVNNLDRAKAALAGSNLRQVSEEFEAALPKLGTARVIYCRDPEGYLIELVGPK
jgi:catechol 2,3-dioxygenase-like lactoylglutathione lyase family enzyme